MTHDPPPAPEVDFCLYVACIVMACKGRPAATGVVHS